MPEGPEVKRIGMELAMAISGKTLVEANLISGRYTKKSPSGWGELQKRLPLKIIGAGVHGKFIYWLCNNETFIYSTLGMTGNWNDQTTKHTRIGFKFLNGSEVFYNDQRNFGTIKVVVGKQNLINKLQSMGPDMLTEDIPDEKFVKTLRVKSNWGITKAIMDQSVICGVGNYIKADSLWLAKMNPHKLVCECTDGELAILNRSIKKVMRESFDSDGSTVKAYQAPIMNKAGTARRFLVYSQDLDPSGYIVKKEETADGRTTHWVPEVQK